MLERIVHPAVAKRRETFLKRHRARHMVVLDIPLLLEKKSWQQVDLVLVVSAPAWIQRAQDQPAASFSFPRAKGYQEQPYAGRDGA